MIKPQFDIILFGATSFVGRLVARHIQALIDQHSLAVPENFSWAMAARNEKSLQTVKTELGTGARQLPLIVADAQDEDSLRQMCQQGRVIISTVGPYALYGETLIKVCAATGTDYCDLTGEVQWIRRMLDRYQESAKQSGARIVNSCGFDSVPSDLGVSFLQGLAKEKTGQPCSTIKMGVVAAKGGFSGGTIASMLNVAEEAKADKSLRKKLADPYWLCPDNHTFSAHQPKAANRFDPDFNSWTTPFLMAGINTRIVHRSNALLDKAYDTSFIYSEEMLLGKKGGRVKGWLFRAGLGLFFLGLLLPPTRWLLKRFVLPKPGQGPSEAQQRAGYFSLWFIGLGAGDTKIEAMVEGDGDPGYSATAKMLTQAALSIAFDIDQNKQGGFYTPAALMSNALIDRLNKYAGIAFTTKPSSS